MNKDSIAKALKGAKYHLKNIAQGKESVGDILYAVRDSALNSMGSEIYPTLLGTDKQYSKIQKQLKNTAKEISSIMSELPSLVGTQEQMYKIVGNEQLPQIFGTVETMERDIKRREEVENKNRDVITFDTPEKLEEFARSISQEERENLLVQIDDIYKHENPTILGYENNGFPKGRKLNKEDQKRVNQYTV